MLRHQSCFKREGRGGPGGGKSCTCRSRGKGRLSFLFIFRRSTISFVFFFSAYASLPDLITCFLLSSCLGPGSELAVNSHRHPKPYPLPQIVRLY